MSPSLPLPLSPGNEEHELAALVVLLRRELVPSSRVSALVEEQESAITVLSDLGSASLFPLYSGADVEDALDKVRSWMERGLDVRPIFHRAYPESLRGIYNKPPILFVQGSWIEHRDSRSLAIVGTRKATELGLRIATEAAAKAVSAGLTVLSGMAAGIDTAAHTSALEHSGRTVAVIGTGIDHVFPPENRGLRDRILTSGGAIFSQFFPGQPPTKWSFPMRNIVMSGLALATFVVEASETSGARKQARAALEHGRPVFLLSSLVETHEWADRMVRQGEYGVCAIQVASIDEVVERLTEVPTLDHAIAV
jgi:DNA processing protein